MRTSVTVMMSRLSRMNNLPPREQWRKHPMLNPSGMTWIPGLPLGIAAFGAYYIYDTTIAPKPKDGHGHGH